MKTAIKLAFFLWLAISAGMVWVTSDYEIAGKISKVWLCLLSFFGGITGITWIIHQEMTSEN